MSGARLAFCIVALLATPAWGDDISLVRVGEAWRYYRGTNEPTSPVTAWRQLDFDDSAWLEGESGFSTTGYSDTFEATHWNQLGPAPVTRSFYLRRKFTVADPQAVTWLILRLDYTHGFVAYLNGQEIVRRGLTNDLVACNDYAEYHFSGSAEEFNISGFSGLLSAGENVLAIQVHTAATNPPGYGSSMRLVPELLANFQRGPLVANASTNSIQVIWRTPVPADSIVEFGTNQALAMEISDSALTTNHVVTLTNLLPGTKYSYRIRSTAAGRSASSPTFSFDTFKPNGDLTFLVLADTEDGSLAKCRLAGTMEQTEADLALHCGDLMYNYFSLGREDYRCLSVYGRQMRSSPFYFSMGNHDIHPTLFDEPFLQTFYLPTNPITGTGHFYSFDHGDAHFTVLFLPWLKNVPQLEPYQLTNGSPQYCWLTNDLATSSKPWKFVFTHVGLADSGYHRLDDDNANGIYDTIELQEWLLPVMQRYGVQIVFHGHNHNYERSNPMRGVYEITTGGGGGRLPNYGFADGRSPASSQFYLLSEFVRVTIQGDSLLLQAIGTNGVAFDSMTIQRSLPPPQEYTASWHIPLVESVPADDGYGNINGQTFDFSGAAIPALAGGYANLGRVYVNNDATNLFIGLEQMMIYSDQNVFLFLELPGQNGVTNLAGLGDGQAGTAEGVDALDFLENLSFTNFAPAVACVLGDEYDDGQDRHFVRPGLRLDLGQGVFRLDTDFPEVSGIRLQQFNRSPQALEPPKQLKYPERNANFIEVAIPLDQLGGLRPGDTIRMAAVVGRSGCDTNAQTRELESSFLGSVMTGSGQSNVVLGGVSVRLAPAVLAVKADDQERPYGAINGPLTASYSGFVNGQDTGILSGSPELSTGAETSSAVGTYAIHAGQGSLSAADTNYSFAFLQGTLTVTRAGSSNALISGQNPSANRDNVTFSAMVSPIAPATITPTGTVRFLNNGMELGTVGLSNGIASISTVLWTPGTNEVRAEYLGDDNFLGSTGSLRQVVTAPCSSTSSILSIMENRTNNTFALTFLGTVDAQYCLLETTNLTASMTDWTVVPDSTNIATNGIWSFTVTNAGTPVNGLHRFFRAGAVNPCP